MLEKLLRTLASPEAKILAAHTVEGDKKAAMCLDVIRSGTFPLIDQMYLTLASRAVAIQLTKNVALRIALDVTANEEAPF